MQPAATPSSFTTPPQAGSPEAKETELQQQQALHPLPSSWQQSDATLGHVKVAYAASPMVATGAEASKVVPSAVPTFQEPIKPGTMGSMTSPIPELYGEMAAPGYGAWASGLFDCDGFSRGQGCSADCCMASFCACFIYGQNVSVLAPEEACCGGREQGACWSYLCLDMVPTMLMWATAGIIAAKGGGAHAAMCAEETHKLPGCACYTHRRTRKAIRERYGIPGSDCEDCATTFFCGCCAMLQERKELQKRGAFYQKFVDPQLAGLPSVQNAMPQH